MNYRIAPIAAALAILLTTGCATKMAGEKKREGEPCEILYDDLTAAGRNGWLRCVYRRGNEGRKETKWTYREWGTTNLEKGGEVGDNGKKVGVDEHADEDTGGKKYYRDYEIFFSSHVQDDQPPDAAVRVFDDKRATLTVRHKP